MTAWAVNALYHQERRRFDDLLDAASAVRAALAGKGDRRQAEAARRQALQALLGRAAKILATAGHAATPANRQRISHTLETLAARDPAADGPRPGRLAADLEPQGFDVLAGLAASLAPATAPAAGSARSADGEEDGQEGRGDGRPRSGTSASRRRAASWRRRRPRSAGWSGRSRRPRPRRPRRSSGTQRLAEEAAEATRRAAAARKAAAAAKDDLATAKAAAAKASAARRRGRSRVATARRQVGARSAERGPAGSRGLPIAARSHVRMLYAGARTDRSAFSEDPQWPNVSYPGAARQTTASPPS